MRVLPTSSFLPFSPSYLLPDVTRQLTIYCYGNHSNVLCVYSSLPRYPFSKPALHCHGFTKILTWSYQSSDHTLLCFLLLPEWLKCHWCTSQTDPSPLLQSTVGFTSTPRPSAPRYQTLMARSHPHASEQAGTSAWKVPFLLLSPQHRLHCYISSKDSPGNPGKINPTPPYASSSRVPPSVFQQCLQGCPSYSTSLKTLKLVRYKHGSVLSFRWLLPTLLQPALLSSGQQAPLKILHSIL